MVVVCMERKLCLVLTSRTYQESLLLFDLAAVVIQDPGLLSQHFTGVRDQYYQQTTEQHFSLHFHFLLIRKGILRFIPVF